MELVAIIFNLNQLVSRAIIRGLATVSDGRKVAFPPSAIHLYDTEPIDLLNVICVSSTQGHILLMSYLAELPKQGVQIHALILQGGPFAHENEGSVFGNREQLLPAQKRGYYREYTVPTPGASTRGQRRIGCGGQAKAPDACYYTADHYTSFRRIEP